MGRINIGVLTGVEDLSVTMSVCDVGCMTGDDNRHVIFTEFLHGLNMIVKNDF